MKKITLICLSILFWTSIAFAQNQDTITVYYDDDWAEVSSQDSAKYYGKTYLNEDNLWVALDYYENGQLQMRGLYKTMYREDMHGEFEYYYENGQLKRKGKAIHNKKEGLWTEWREDGQIHTEIKYKADQLNGELYTYWENGEIKRRDIFSNDELVRGEVRDSTGQTLPYFDYLYMPEFRGGQEQFVKYLLKKTKYPPEARRKGIEGKVSIQFDVQKDGSIANVKIKEGVDPLLDKEALRVISNMPKWKPGRIDGEFANFTMELPINFRHPE